MSDADGHICSKRAVHHIQIAGVGNSFCGGGGKVVMNDGGGCFQAAFQVFHRKRSGGNSAHARDQSGDSLFRLLEKSIVEISHHVAVAVGIYESGRQGESVGIDHHARLLRILFPDGFDRSILNKDIRRESGSSASVNNICILNYKFFHIRSSIFNG